MAKVLIDLNKCGEVVQVFFDTWQWFDWSLLHADWLLRVKTNLRHLPTDIQTYYTCNNTISASSSELAAEKSIKKMIYFDLRENYCTDTYVSVNAHS